MTIRINRKDLIVEVASDLFLRQGYEATSVRQIANEVGVTEAALYYHFKDGKRELLKAVFECHIPNFKQVLEACTGAESLAELLQRFGQAAAKIAPRIVPRIRWFISEYPNLDENGRNVIRQKMVMFHDSLAELIAPFVNDADASNALAWAFICIIFGHNQIFGILELNVVVDFHLQHIMRVMGERLG